MTNAEKYKTAKERADAFIKWCKSHTCITFPCKKWACAFDWLDAEAKEEKPLPCPFCGANTEERMEWNELHRVVCINPNCWYSSKLETNAALAIASHNRIASMVKAMKEVAK